MIAGVGAVILLRNTPRYVQTPPRELLTEKPPVLEVPSKSNVSSSFTVRVEQLKKSVNANPANASHLIALAQLLMDGHSNKEAITYFERAAVLQPMNDSLLLDLSVCYFNEHLYDKALRITEKILAKNKYHVRALYNKGSILATINRTTEAVTVWKTLIRHHPQSEEARTAAGNISLLEKK